MSVLSTLAGAVVLTGGMATQRFSGEQLSIFQSVSEYQPGRLCFGVQSEGKSCIFGDTDAEVRWVLWGDSHAKSILPALEILALRNGVGLLFIAAPTCPPLLDAIELNPGPHFEKCRKRRQADLERITTLGSVDVVFLAARWTLYVEGQDLAVERAVKGARQGILYDAADGRPSHPDISQNPSVVLNTLTAVRDRLLANGKRVVLFGTVPEMPWDVRDRLVASILFDAPLPATVTLSDVARRQSRSDIILAEVARAPNTFFIPLAQEICRPECPTHDETAIFYRDDNHLSYDGSVRLLVPILDRTIPAEIALTE
jgi:hypothetical protein